MRLAALVKEPQSVAARVGPRAGIAGAEASRPIGQEGRC